MFVELHGSFTKENSFELVPILVLNSDEEELISFSFTSQSCSLGNSSTEYP